MLRHVAYTGLSTCIFYKIEQGLNSYVNGLFEKSLKYVHAHIIPNMEKFHHKIKELSSSQEYAMGI